MLCALLALVTVLCALSHAAGSARAAGLSFYGSFEDGITPWNLGGGGPQCANYGTVSDNQRLRGNLFMDTSVGGQGTTVARFDLPPSQLPDFPLQACELTHPVPLGLGTDDYYGYMFYVPVGWDTGSSAWYGINVAQFHFQNIWAAPLLFELHDDHLTLAIESGACNSYLTSNPGCQFRSNADDNSCHTNSAYTCLPPLEAVPSPMEQGVWHEVIMHVHWAADASGAVEAWTRIEGDPNWTQTVQESGFPTVQWDVTTGCCLPNATDKVGAYRGLATSPVSVWEDNISVGSDFATVAATMPMAPGGPPPPAPAPNPAPPPSTPAPKPPRKPRHSVGAHTARSQPARAKPFGRRCVAAPARRAWLRHHRQPGALRRQVLAMRRVRHGRGRGATVVYCF